MQGYIKNVTLSKEDQMSEEVVKQIEGVQQEEISRTEALAREGKSEVEVWICLNEASDYQLGVDEDQAAEDFDRTYGGQRRRTFRLWLTLPLPQVTEVSGELPEAEGGAYSLEVRPA
jgi:hypothetical protein